MATSSRERIARLELWVKGYRSMSALHEDVHTAHTEASRIDDDTFAHISVTDVEWLLRVAQLAGDASAEARIEMRKGHPGSFEEDFPATTALARALFLDEEAGR